MSRFRGLRVWWCLPFAVVRLFRGHHATLLRHDVTNSRRAALSPLFADLAVRQYMIALRITLSRRYGRVEIADHDAIAALGEDFLKAAKAAPPEPLASYIQRQPLFSEMREEERRWLIDRAAGSTLPLTGAHGDFRLFNFCKSETGYVLIDWEHFDERGSFALDYIEFTMSHQCFSTPMNWVSFLAGRSSAEPVVQSMARTFNIDADALWALYLMNELSVFADRRGGFGRLPDARLREYMELVRARVARMLPAVSGVAQADQGHGAAGLRRAAII